MPRQESETSEEATFSLFFFLFFSLYYFFFFLLPFPCLLFQRTNSRSFCSSLILRDDLRKSSFHAVTLCLVVQTAAVAAAAVWAAILLLLLVIKWQTLLSAAGRLGMSISTDHDSWVNQYVCLCNDTQSEQTVRSWQNVSQFQSFERHWRIFFQRHCWI